MCQSNLFEYKLGEQTDSDRGIGRNNTVQIEKQLQQEKLVAKLRNDIVWEPTDVFNLLVSDALEAGVLLDGCCGRSKHKIQKGEVSDNLWYLANQLFGRDTNAGVYHARTRRDYTRVK